MSRLFEPPRRFYVLGWEVLAMRAFPPRPWLPRLTRVSTGWKRGWGYRGGLFWKGGDLRWLTVYLSWRKPK
jgi:hypothetical protein